MKKIYLTGLLIIYVWNISLGLDKSYCFQFTWLGRKVTSINCTAYKDIPCIEPIYTDPKPPNTTDMWNIVKDRKPIGNLPEYLCELKLDNVCIKYTYIYNNAIVNISYFCGKVIEDQTSAITSGCYAQYAEGYTIEACACQSRMANMPCNSTTRNTFSILIIFVVPLFMYICKIFYIS